MDAITYTDENDSTIDSYAFIYDSNDRIITLTNGLDGVTTYSYDNTNQVIGAEYTTGHPLASSDESYTYDENGNRTSAATDVGKSNQLYADSDATYTYDAEGNLTSKTDSTTGEYTAYSWDQRGRLIEVATYTDSTETTLVSKVDYTYDALNRRIGKEIDTDGSGSADEVERYVYDGSQLALVYNGDGTLTHRYMYGPAVDMVLSDEAFDSATGDFDDVYWALGDHQNSVRDVVTYSISGGAELAEHVVYDSFGNAAVVVDGNGDPTGAPPTIGFAYTGQEYDAETGLYYYESRYYDASTGRFISQDPVSFGAGDPNLYRYVGNRTTTYVDPVGTAAAHGFIFSTPRPSTPKDGRILSGASGYMPRTPVPGTYGGTASKVNTRITHS